MADDESDLPPEEEKLDTPVEITLMLSDVGRYSYAGLSAVSLLKLFEDEWHSEFKKKTLQSVLDHLSQSQASCKTMFLVMEGEGMSEAGPFVDALLKESSLKWSRMLLLEDMVRMAVSNGCYDARWRVLIKHMCLQLQISWDDLEQVETTLTETLEESAYEMSDTFASSSSWISHHHHGFRIIIIMDFASSSWILHHHHHGFHIIIMDFASSSSSWISHHHHGFCIIIIMDFASSSWISHHHHHGFRIIIIMDFASSSSWMLFREEKCEKAKKCQKEKIKRYALIGIATIGGGALIGLTGGLAAPLVAAGAAAIIGGAGAAALGSTAGVAIIGSLFGVAGAGLVGFKMKKRVGALEEFSFEPLMVVGSHMRLSEMTKQLHITVAVTGWLTDSMNDFQIPWKCLAESKEQYSVCWESKYLLQLGNAFEYILSIGMGVATSEALKYTVLAGIMAAVAWPSALMRAAGVIDNPWSVVTQRANNVGKQLAEVLLAREQGNRPVTLIGYSMGARVIFSCLEELSTRKGSEGLVENVILLGAPVSGDPKNWQPLARVVAGRIVNGYCKSDWLLKFVHRTTSVQINIAGLGPVMWENRRMHNIDLSGVVEGHRDYEKNLDTIMKAVGVRTKDVLKVSSKVKKKLPRTTASSGNHSSQQSQGETMTTSQIQTSLSTENGSLVSSQNDSIQLPKSRSEVPLSDSISTCTVMTPSTVVDDNKSYCEPFTQESGSVSLRPDVERDFTISPQPKDTNENEVEGDEVKVCGKVKSDGMDADKASQCMRTGRNKYVN